MLLKKRVSKIDYLILPQNSRFVKGGLEASLNIFRFNKIFVNDKRICNKFNLTNCFTVSENLKINNLKVVFPPANRYYLLNYKNSSIVLKINEILITGYFTKDILEFLKYKKINFNTLISFGSNVKNFCKNEIIITRRKMRGYIEINLKNGIISNYIKNQRKKSLLYWFLKKT